MTNVCIFAPSLNHEFETIGFYFRTSGANVIFVSQADGDDRSEHPRSLRRVQQTYCLRSISDAPDRTDLLISDAFIDPRYMPQCARWASHASELAFLFPDRGTTLKRRLGHLVRSWPHSISARMAIFFGDRRLSLDTLSPAFQKRTFFPPYLHPQLFSGNTLRQVFARVDANLSRRYSIGFMGNKNPKERSVALTESQRAIDQAGAPSFWIEYGDNEHQAALTPEHFISALDEMDFCICPAGWSNWTHRVIESLCRGAIPILPYPHLYGLGLRHSVNSISVRGADWYGSVRHALGLPADTVREMRKNVLDLREALLVPAAASQRFCDQFGIGTQLPHC